MLSHIAHAVAAPFQETRHIVVREGAKQVDNLNELEYIKGEIYANVA